MTHRLPLCQLSRRAFFGRLSRSMIGMSLLAACSPTRGTLLPPQDSPPDASLDVKIGQMIMVGLQGTTVGPEHAILDDIRQRHLGGIILLDWAGNIQSPDQVIALVSVMRSAASMPLLVAIDHEGGSVTHLTESLGFAPTASHHYLGRLNDVAVTHAYATTMAQTLAWLGINLNLAPVVDLNTNLANPIIARHERSFSADPAVVTSQALVFIQAHHEQGVLCTLKHFPGHGSSQHDSHIGMADVTATWSPDELRPYQSIIEAGHADVIMTGHVFNTSLDATYPATLSQATITGMLRGELGYDGVIISDDMHMGAIRNYYGFETVVQRAIEAGVDIMLFADPDPDQARRVHDYITWLVQNNIIGEDRITASYQRIHRLKRRLAEPRTKN